MSINNKEREDRRNAILSNKICTALLAPVGEVRLVQQGVKKI